MSSDLECGHSSPDQEPDRIDPELAKALKRLPRGSCAVAVPRVADWPKIHPIDFNRQWMGTGVGLRPCIVG